VAAAVIAWKATAVPWVTLTITDMTDPLLPVLVGHMTLDGTQALVGTIAQVLVGIVGVSAVLWFVYSFNRGSTMPWFANPAWAILATVAGGAGMVLSSELWFVWEDAAIRHARQLHLSALELRTLLDTQPGPIVEIEKLSGLLQFGAVMGAGFLAASMAWWAYRRRN
jgi:hypothetical protein